MGRRPPRFRRQSQRIQGERDGRSDRQRGDHRRKAAVDRKALRAADQEHDRTGGGSDVPDMTPRTVDRVAAGPSAGRVPAESRHPHCPATAARSR